MRKLPQAILCLKMAGLAACRFVGGEQAVEDLLSKEITSQETFEKMSTEAGRIESFKGAKGTIIRAQSESSLSLERGRELVKSRISQVQLIYEPEPAAYPGMISRETRCVQVFNLSPPVREDESMIAVRFELKATARLTYGSCVDSELPFKSQYWIAYCKNGKTLREIKIFYDRNRETLKEDVARCP